MFFEKRRFSIEFNFQIKDFFLDEIPTNPCSSWGFVLPIIPYQVITGNYNKDPLTNINDLLYHTK